MVALMALGLPHEFINLSFEPWENSCFEFKAYARLQLEHWSSAEGDCSEVCGSAGEKTIEGLLHGCINPLIVMDLYKHM